MTEIYLVTSGEHSDYAVHAAFEAKEDADRIASMMAYGEVKTMPVYPPGDTTYRRREEFYAVTHVNHVDGKYPAPECRGPYLDWGGDEIATESWAGNYWRGQGDRTIVSCTAPTREAAVKGCRDKAAEVAARIVGNT